ncbi:MAG TPA: DUF4349 domain-containing protein [Candidatus Dormibacteraeota bacterium]
MSASRRAAGVHRHVGEQDLSAFIDGELPDEGRAAVEEALDRCVSCRGAHDAISDVAERVRGLELEPPPAGLLPDLPGQEPAPLRLGVGPWLRSLGHPRQLRLAAGVAVVAVGASLLVARVSSPRTTPIPPANIAAGLGMGGDRSGGGTPADSTGSTTSADRGISGAPGVPPVHEGAPQAIGTADPARIARTGEVRLEVARDRFDRTVEAVQAAQAGVAGYTAESRVSEGDNRSAELVVRVPTDRFQEAMTRLRGVARVVSYSTNASDVTKQYVDLQARITGLRAQVGAMTRLLDRASSVPDVLAVQQQLGQLQSQVDQTQGEINYLNQSTAMASITVTVTQQPGSTTPNRIGDALHRAGESFISTLQAVIITTGTLAPLLLLAGGVLLIVLATRRRRPHTA